MQLDLFFGTLRQEMASLNVDLAKVYGQDLLTFSPSLRQPEFSWESSAEAVYPYTLHPTPYTLHPTPYALHSTFYTLRTTPYSLHPTPYTRLGTPYTLHPSSYTLHATP